MQYSNRYCINMFSVRCFYFYTMLYYHITIISKNGYADNRFKRQFPINSAMGYFVAIAIPLESYNRNVFVSYNFEANFGLPYNPLNFRSPAFETAKVHNQNKRNANTIMTRKLFYKIIKEKLELYGYPGKSCLLRLICELSENPLNVHNGIFGDLIKILVLPSTSQNENLPNIYYKTEEIGRNGTGCRSYSKKCNTNILDLISVNR